MRIATREEQQNYLKPMDETHRIMDEMRLEALRGKPYDWR